MEDASTTNIQDYTTELEAGVFNLIISLVSHRANLVGQDEARRQVAVYLERLAKALREQD